jgi:hypothetical protein
VAFGLSGGGSEAARLVISLAVNNSGAMRALGDVQARMADMGRGLKDAVGGPLEKAMFAFGNIGDAADGVRSVAGAVNSLIGPMIMGAAKMETFAMQFEVLLGSADAAKARMADLSTFAATTPFELPGIVEASRLLQTFTDGALASGDGLRMVGDVAAGVGKPIEDVAFKVGRMYDAFRSGTNIGESLMYLQEMGAISGASRRKIEALAKAVQEGGMTMEDAWKEATKEFGKFGGMTEKLAKSTEGKLSTAIDAINMGLAKLGEKLLPIVKSGLDLVVPLMDAFSFVAEKLGKYWFVITPFIVAAGKALVAYARNTLLAGTATGLLGVALKSLPIIGWITAAITAMELLSAAWESNFLGIRGIVESVVGFLKTNFGWLFDALGGLANIVGNLVGSFARPREAAVKTGKEVIKSYVGMTVAVDKGSGKIVVANRDAADSFPGVASAAEGATKDIVAAMGEWKTAGKDASTGVIGAADASAAGLIAASGRVVNAYGATAEASTATRLRIEADLTHAAAVAKSEAAALAGAFGGTKELKYNIAVKQPDMSKYAMPGMTLEEAWNKATGGIQSAASKALNGQVIAAEYQRKRLLAKWDQTVGDYIAAIMASRETVTAALNGLLDFTTAEKTIQLAITVGKADIASTEAELRNVNRLIDQYDNARLTAKQRAFLKEQGLTAKQYLDQLRVEKAGLDQQLLQQQVEQQKRLAELTKYGTVAQRISRLQGLASSAALGAGLRDGNEDVRTATFLTLRSIYAELNKLKSETGSYGYKTVAEYAAGMRRAGGLVRDAAGNVVGKARDGFVAHSPPGPKSPLHKIDVWGYRTGKAWADGMVAGVSTLDVSRAIPSMAGVGLGTAPQPPAASAALAGAGYASGPGAPSTVGAGSLTVQLSFSSAVPYTPAEQTALGQRVGPAVYDYLRSRGAV